MKPRSGLVRRQAKLRERMRILRLLPKANIEAEFAKLRKRIAQTRGQ